MYAHPIYSKEGNYPPIVISSVAKNSIEEGFPKSRLPEFTKNEIEYIRGTGDYVGLNYYTSRIVELDTPNITDPPFFLKDMSIIETVDPNWPKSKSSWLYSAPEGFRVLMDWVSKQYGGVEMWITENGWSDDGQLNDLGRVSYYQEHLKVCLQSILCDKVNLNFFTAWSIIDNFEWMKGYT